MSCASSNAILTHLSLASHKRDIDKQSRPRSDAAKRGVCSGSTLSALSLEISTKLKNNKNYPHITYIGNGPVQRHKVNESTRNKWVKGKRYTFRASLKIVWSSFEKDNKAPFSRRIECSRKEDVTKVVTLVQMVEIVQSL